MAKTLLTLVLVLCVVGVVPLAVARPAAAQAGILAALGTATLTNPYFLAFACILVAGGLVYATTVDWEASPVADWWDDLVAGLLPVEVQGLMVGAFMTWAQGAGTWGINLSGLLEGGWFRPVVDSVTGYYDIEGWDSLSYEGTDYVGLATSPTQATVNLTKDTTAEWETIEWLMRWNTTRSGSSQDVGRYIWAWYRPSNSGDAITLYAYFVSEYDGYVYGKDELTVPAATEVIQTGSWDVTPAVPYNGNPGNELRCFISAKTWGADDVAYLADEMAVYHNPVGGSATLDLQGAVQSVGDYRAYAGVSVVPALDWATQVEGVTKSDVVAGTPDWVKDADDVDEVPHTGTVETGIIATIAGLPAAIAEAVRDALLGVYSDVGAMLEGVYTDLFVPTLGVSEELFGRWEDVQERFPFTAPAVVSGCLAAAVVSYTGVFTLEVPLFASTVEVPIGGSGAMNDLLGTFGHWATKIFVIYTMVVYCYRRYQNLLVRRGA